MKLVDKDLKMLWGRAAGRCSRPSCGLPLLPLLGAEVTILGEMAHIIASSPLGPRGGSDSGSDSYSNLILLCPTHHTEIDKSPPGTYPAELLHEWKRLHEARVEAALSAVRYDTRHDLFSAVRRILSANKALWATYGPESAEAQLNPLSNLADRWEAYKFAELVPGNQSIINLIEANDHLLTHDEWELACRFKEHARGFRDNLNGSTSGVPKFPVEFEKMVRANAE